VMKASKGPTLCVCCRCAYCQVSYDVIGKVETLAEDFAFISDRTDMGRDARSDLWRTSYVSRIDREKIAAYFSTLPKELKARLDDLYKLDFELFDYSRQDY